MNLFEEIDSYKKELPKVNKIAKEVKNQNLNAYQKVSVVIMVIGFFVGIIFGNLFPSCGSTSTLYGVTSCDNTEFNISLTLFFWFICFVFCMWFYGFGQIITLLTSIDEKLTPKSKKK